MSADVEIKCQGHCDNCPWAEHQWDISGNKFIICKLPVKIDTHTWLFLK